MTGFKMEAGLCALGRFGTAQIVNSSQRLIRPLIREGEELIPTDWEAAIKAATNGLQGCSGAVAIVVSEATTREDRFLYRQLAEQLHGTFIVLPASSGSDDPLVQPLASAVQSGAIRALVTNGNLLKADILRAVPFSLMIDCLPSAVADLATVVLPAAVLNGHFRAASGTLSTWLSAACHPAMPGLSGGFCWIWAKRWPCRVFAGSTVGTLQIGHDPAPAPVAGTPRQNVRHLVTRFRGHLLADVIPALAAFGLPATPAAVGEEAVGEGFALLEKQSSPICIFLRSGHPRWQVCPAWAVCHSHGQGNIGTLTFYPG